MLLRTYYMYIDVYLHVYTYMYILTCIFISAIESAVSLFMCDITYVRKNKIFNNRISRKSDSDNL